MYLNSEVTILHNGWRHNKCTKVGTIKDRNSMDLKEAKYIKKKWPEYTEELCKKDLNDPWCDYPLKARLPRV